MRKYFLGAGFILSFFSPSFSQTQYEINYRLKSDSLKTVLPGLKSADRVDCLNTLSSIYVSDLLGTNYQKEIDTATMYAMQAFSEAKKTRYKRGLGYAYLRLGQALLVNADIHYNVILRYTKSCIDSIEQNVAQAIKIGEEINDNVMLGNSYWLLSAIQDWKKTKDDQQQYLAYLRMALSYFEKQVNQKQKVTYAELDQAICEGCEGNEIRIGNLYIELGRFYSNQRDETTAIEITKKAIPYFEKAGHKRGLGWAYGQIANSDFRINNYEIGKKNAEKSISYNQEAGCESCLVGGYISLGNWSLSWGDFENGLEYCKKSLGLLEKNAKNDKDGHIGHKYSWMNAYQLMGSLYIRGGDYESALLLLKKARPYFDYENSLHKNTWIALMGEVFRLKGEYDSAMYYLSGFGLGKLHVGGKMSLGKLYIDLKEYDTALPLLLESIDAIKKGKDPGNIGWSYMYAAKAYLGKQDYKTALKYATEALALQKSVNRKLFMGDNYDLLSKIFNKMGTNDSAYYYLRQYTTLKDSLLTRQFLWKLSNYKKEAEEERKIGQINLLNKDNQLKEQKLKQEATLKKALIAGLILSLLLGVFIFRNLTLKRKTALEKQRLESEKKQTELEMQALRAQMNPHFIFNCLSSINRFILKNESKIASNYLTRFSRLIRMVLMNSQKSLISLDDELQMLELYLEMERLRFKNSFDYAITFLNAIDNDNVFIPPLLLQPFCENAIWHGLMHKEGQGRLDIELSMEDKVLNCIITDNGVGREKAEEMKSKTAEKEKSMGLKITTERLAILNREKGLHTFYDIEDLKDENGNGIGTKVNLKITFKNSVEEFV
jgi:histidine kinase